LLTFQKGNYDERATKGFPEGQSISGEENHCSYRKRERGIILKSLEDKVMDWRMPSVKKITYILSNYANHRNKGVFSEE